MNPHTPFTLTVAASASDHMLGPPHAPVTVVEYGDLECPNCKQAVAGGQGKFWEMHDLLFDNQNHLELDHLRGYAKRLQLDLARFDVEMADRVYLQRIREHQQSGRDSGVRSTPAFFVNGRIQDVSFGMHLLLDAVKSALHA